MAASAGDITRLLTDWRHGDQTALERLIPLVRAELARIARRHLRFGGDDALVHPSSLLQETYLRLLPEKRPWENRGHFFAVASKVMRHVLVDHARQRRRAKRGGSAARVPLDLAVVLSPEQVDEVVAIDMALQRLTEIAPRKAQVFEMRFFGGMTIEETAGALGVGTRTVVRDWQLARAWLRRELSQRADDRGPMEAD